MQTKWCNYCKITQTTDNFGKDSRTKSGLRVYCRKCEVIRRKESYKINRLKRIKSSMEWKQKNRIVDLKYQREYRQKIREKILEVYGKKCQCCGENHQEFLTIDHINGGGREHRKHIGTLHAYKEIIRENNHDKYRVLCMNCNWAIRFNKICPHKQALSKAGAL